jgi:hypothetical protein
MTERDPLDSLEQALFRAARRERPRTEALERTANAVVASHRQRRSQRWTLMLSGAMALAAGAALILRASPSAESIQAEPIVPKRSGSSSAVGSSAPERAEARVEPTASASASGAGLQSGLTSTTLEEEIAMLDGARLELASDKPESALSLLDQYDRVSGGHLTAEATLLRIQALSSSGRSSLASSLARRFIDSDPQHPLAEQAQDYVVEPAHGGPDPRNR